MGNFSRWFRQAGARFSAGMQRFMAGRYGHDRLNMVLLGSGLVLCLAGMFIRLWWVNLLLTLGSYAMLGLALFRCFSRQTYKRYQENRRFLLKMDQIKDREHRYFICPKCRQTVRVPRGKGKIAITCPKCKEKFVKKS